MDNKVCLSTNQFIFFIFIGVAVICWALWQVSKREHQIQLLKSNKSCDVNQIGENIDEILNQRLKETEKKYSSKQDQLVNILLSANAMQREQDYQRLVNPLIPPL